MYFTAKNIIRMFGVVACTAIYPHIAYGCPGGFSNDKSRMFSPGQSIKIKVMGESDLSQEYNIDDTGMILMPLIGKVLISGISSDKIEEKIISRLKDGYIIDPILSVYPAAPDNFYILGEVKNPGKYDISTNYSLLNAVALAGGFTDQAHKRKFKIIRPKCSYIKNNKHKNLVFAGDTIIVKKQNLTK